MAPRRPEALVSTNVWRFRVFVRFFLSGVGVSAFPLGPLGGRILPPMRRFRVFPIFSVPVLGGSAYLRAQFKKKNGPAARGGLVFLSLFNPWAFGVGLVTL